MRKITHIICHHSAGPATESVAAVKAYHIKTRGFSDIAYHDIIHKVGAYWVHSYGRPYSVVGAHDKGQNSVSIGICVFGDYTKQELPAEALELLVKCIKNHLSFLGTLTVEGHREDGDATLCPGYNMDMIRGLLH